MSNMEIQISDTMYSVEHKKLPAVNQSYIDVILDHHANIGAGDSYVEGKYSGDTTWSVQH